MKTLFLSMMVTLSTPVLAKECIIVIPDDMTVYHHELAHCNGWVHDTKHIPQLPPNAFVHPFDGQLTVIMADGSSSRIIGLFTQGNAEFRYSEVSTHQLCLRMLTENNYYIPTDMQRGERRIGGCAIIPE